MENSIWEWMRSRHNIPVKLDWTKACVDWLLQEEVLYIKLQYVLCLIIEWNDRYW